MTWIETKLSEVCKASPNTTVVLLLDDSKHTSIFENLLGKEMATSTDFTQDLEMTKTAWFYEKTSGKRCLLSLFKIKPDSKEPAVLKEIRGLARKVALELQTKKIIEAEILVPGSFKALELGHFYDSFSFANYERTYKIKTKKDEEEKKDTRLDRFTKNVENLKITCEIETEQKGEAYKLL